MTRNNIEFREPKWNRQVPRLYFPSRRNAKSGPRDYGYRIIRPHPFQGKNAHICALTNPYMLAMVMSEEVEGTSRKRTTKLFASFWCISQAWPPLLRVCLRCLSALLRLLSTVTALRRVSLLCPPSSELKHWHELYNLKVGIRELSFTLQ